VFQVSARWHLTGLTAGALQIDFAAAGTAGKTTNIFVQGVTGLMTVAQMSPFVMQAFSSL
jgi:hypothetical protein